MLNFKNINIFFFIIISSIVIIDIFLTVNILLYVAISIIYTIIISWGSINIGSNFYFKSICSVSTEEKIISLTFDDGPSEYTNQVLDILKERQVKALFFCIGKNIDSNKDILKRIDNENHIIGNHTFTHHFWIDLFSTNKIIAELNKTENAIYEIIKKRIKLFRPPYGVTNPNICKAIKIKQHTSIGWSIRTFDTNKTEAQVLNKLKNELKPGAIILMHDTKETIIPILTNFIEFAIENGYKIVRLDELLKIQPYE